MTEKLAVVASGGGVTCSYTAGCILGLVDKFKLTNPDVVIGGSGSAGTMAYYVSGQYKSIRNIWENLLATHKFISYWRFWKVIDIDYLIDDVFKKQDQLQTDKVYESRIDFLIPMTNIATGMLEYFSNRDRSKNVFEAMRASKAMPLVYGRKIQIGESSYCDTRLSANIAANVEKATQLGAEKIVTFDTSHSSPVVDAAMNQWVNTMSKTFKRNYDSELNRLRNFDYKELMFLMTPATTPKASMLESSQKALKATVKQGYDDTVNNKELECYLNS